jgi:hypothetical protein
MKKDIITVTSPLLPDLDEFHELLKDIWDRKWITNNGHYHQLLERACFAPMLASCKNGSKMTAYEEK